MQLLLINALLKTFKMNQKMKKQKNASTKQLGYLPVVVTIIQIR